MPSLHNRGRFRSRFLDRIGRPTKWFGTWRSSKLPEAIKAGILAIVRTALK